MKSNFRFLSYKIDSFNFDIAYCNKIIYSNRFEGDFNFSIALKQPMFIESESTYLGGFNCKLSLEDKDIPQEDKNVFLLESGIVGSFMFEEAIPQKNIDALVKKQIPAILLPYMRGAISSFLANAGFGSIILPLINMNVVAEHSGEIEIKII